MQETVLCLLNGGCSKEVSLFEMWVSLLRNPDQIISVYDVKDYVVYISQQFSL